MIYNVEDMTKLIHQSVVHSNGGLILSKALMARNLVKLGYHKIADDEVVMRRSDFEEYIRLKASHEHDIQFKLEQNDEQ